MPRPRPRPQQRSRGGARRAGLLNNRQHAAVSSWRVGVEVQGNWGGGEAPSLGLRAGIQPLRQIGDLPLPERVLREEREPRVRTHRQRPSPPHAEPSPARPSPVTSRSPPGLALLPLGVREAAVGFLRHAAASDWLGPLAERKARVSSRPCWSLLFSTCRLVPRRRQAHLLVPTALC